MNERMKGGGRGELNGWRGGGMDGGGEGVEGMERKRNGCRGRGRWGGMDGVGEGVEWMEKKRGRWTESTSDQYGEWNKW